ncbi:hypothetical protein [Paenibacillus sp. 32352]|uniref:hypothetical protein n=1 Tax=Paenibacillus sp. 32352 TaxID=1969111 RepID=UPI0009AE6DBC|nr:hypothetical protein [Paenibacillus sp. 32352]
MGFSEKFSKKVPRGILTIIAIMILFSVHYGLAMKFPINSDSANVINMAAEIYHGNVLLSGWQVGPEPFYTSDVIFYLIPMLITGFHYKLGYIVTAIMYTTVVIMIFLLGKEKSYARFIVLGFVSIPCVFLARMSLIPGIHTGSMMLVLISLWFLFKKNSIWLYGLFLYLASFGDPFVIYYFVLPMLITAALLLIKSNKREYVKWLAATLTPVILSKFTLKIFELSGGFTQIETSKVNFVSFSDLGKTFIITIQGLLEMYNANFFGKEVFSFETLIILFHFLLFISILIVFIKACINFTKLEDLSQFLVIACLINLAEYIFSNQSFDLGTTRYLFPFFVFSAILVSRYLSIDYYIRNKLLYYMVMVLLLVSFVSPLNFKYNSNTELESFLISKGLVNGYAPYWYASSLTISTKEQVRVSPVMVKDNKIKPYLMYANKYSYIKGGQFVLFPSDTNNDGVNLSVAENTFGKPDEVHQIANNTILIWNKKIILDL